MSRDLPPIIMYARQRFCPDVARSRMHLEELGFEWQEFDIESDPEALSTVRELTGRQNVPTVVVGDSVLVEPENDLLDKALAAAGYVLEEVEA
jgi:glutaredoxin